MGGNIKVCTLGEKSGYEVFLASGNEWTDVEVSNGRADPQFTISYSHFVHYFIVYSALNKDSRRCGTCLSSILDSCIYEEWKGCFYVCIIEYELRGFTPKFERDREDILRGSGLDQLTCADRAREGHVVDAFVR